MDTSQQYIEMCRKAEEIQDQWKPAEGDFIYFPELKYDDDYIARESSITIMGDWVTYKNDPKELSKYPRMADYYDHAFREFSGGYEWEDEFIGFKKDATWLPRQDQLQEMVKKDHIYYMLKNISIFQVKFTTGCGIDTFEKLWLAFVMQEKFNKVWDGQEWVRSHDRGTAVNDKL